MEKRYQVFVSSTFTDLEDERRAVMQALLQLDCIPAGMELFNATDQNQWELIKDVIDRSDYYVLIIGARYGSLTDTGISYTEAEYDYAIDTGKRILTFIHAKPGSIAIDKGETSAAGKKKLQAFIRKAEGKPVVRFSSASELAGQVGLSVATEIRKFGGVGYVRGDQAMTPEIETEIANLRATIASLKQQQHRDRIQGASPAEEAAEIYGSGDESISLGVTYRPDQGYEQYSAIVQKSWNDLFRAVGPSMFERIPESAVRNLLNNELRATLIGQSKMVATGVLNLESASFDQIKVQFRALELIEKAGSVPINGEVLWALTPTGEDELVKLMAIRRRPVEVE